MRRDVQVSSVLFLHQFRYRAGLDCVVESDRSRSKTDNSHV